MDTRMHIRTERRYASELASNGVLALDSQVSLMDLGFAPEAFEQVEMYQVKAWPQRGVEYV